MRRRAIGMTLVEVLIGTVVLACFLTLIATAAVKSYAYWRQSDRVMSSYRNASVQMELMRRQIQQMVQLLSPNTATTFPEGATLTPGATAPFGYVYETWDGTGTAPTALLGTGSGLLKTDGASNPKLVAWRYNATANTLETFVCGDDGITPVGTVRTVVNNVSAFTVTHVARSSNNNLLVLQAQLTVTTDNKSFNFNVVGMPRSVGNGI